MSVINGARLHSIYPPSGVTSISPPSVWPVRLRCSFGPSRHPCIWRHGSPPVTGTVLDLVHSKKNSRHAPPTYATFPSAQNPSTLSGYSKDSYHLLPLSNTFRCPVTNTRTEQHGSNYPSLTLFSMVPPIGSLASISGSATSVGSHRS